MKGFWYWLFLSDPGLTLLGKSGILGDDAWTTQGVAVLLIIVVGGLGALIFSVLNWLGII